MLIRKAEPKDTERILRMLGQVLNIHAEIRPDIFIADTTKYSKEELLDIFADENRPVFVAENPEKLVVGYAFCIIEINPETSNQKAQKCLYIDDLCVDAAERGKGIGKALFEFVKEQAKSMNCDCITLNVWEGNTAAYRFYNNNGFRPRKTLMEYSL